MNNVLHTQLNTLRLISKLRTGQSLYTKDTITVYEFSYVNWVWRKWHNDTKDEVIRFLQEFYKSVEQSVETLISEIHRTDESRKNKLIYVASNLAETVKLSVGGIENLSKTYAAFPRITATLEGIVKDFIVVIYKQLIKTIPESELNKELKNDLSYYGVVLFKGAETVNDDQF